MEERDPDRIADRLEQESESMERNVRELGDDVERTRAEWERKRADPAVPGAPPPEDVGD